MILEFLDESKLDVIAIFGGPKLIMGVMRDTLRIEVSPDIITFDELKVKFKNNPNTALLYTYTDAEQEVPIESTDGDPIMTRQIVTVKNQIGEGYQIFVSISNEERKISVPPGKMVPDEFEEVYVVTIAQMSYQEYKSSIPGEEPKQIPPILNE